MMAKLRGGADEEWRQIEELGKIVYPPKVDDIMWLLRKGEAQQSNDNNISAKEVVLNKETITAVGDDGFTITFSNGESETVRDEVGQFEVDVNVGVSILHCEMSVGGTESVKRSGLEF
jgi:hypothetical protein